MQIIWNPDAALKLQSTHTILELETFEYSDGSYTAWCVVPPEKIGVDGFSRLEANKELHNGFIKAYREKDYKLCEDIAEHLMGQFGGELDTFYEEILSRIKKI